MDLAQGRVELSALVLAALNLRVMGPGFDPGVNESGACGRPAGYSPLAGTGPAPFSRKRKKCKAINFRGHGTGRLGKWPAARAAGCIQCGLGRL
jgi:hypothetical protein